MILVIVILYSPYLMICQCIQMGVDNTSGDNMAKAVENHVFLFLCHFEQFRQNY